MILDRLLQHLFTRDVVIVATSNTSPRELYRGGLNRSLFQPFIGLIEQRMETHELERPRTTGWRSCKGAISIAGASSR